LTDRPPNNPAAARLTLALSDFHIVCVAEVSCNLVVIDGLQGEYLNATMYTSVDPVVASVFGVMSFVATDS
jgi:hypothetical protein